MPAEPISASAAEQMVHGYDRGHQLLATSVNLVGEDQDRVTQLSDLSGLAYSTDIPSYLTCYPLPSQRFYAVARTWQDLEAPRAGCVLTHTILVPWDTWKDGLPVRSVLALHQRPQRNKNHDMLRALDLIPVVAGGDTSHSNFVDTEALLRSLFFRSSAPTVWLTDRHDIEDEVSRLLDFLWPEARANFSVCTYALQERSLAGKPFNLLISPRTSISRFSKIPPIQLVGYRRQHELQTDSREARAIERIAASMNGDLWETYERTKGFLSSELSAVKKVVVLDDLMRRSSRSAVSAIALLDAIEQVAPKADELVLEKQEALHVALQRVHESSLSERIELLAAIAVRSRRSAFRRFSGIRRAIVDNIAAYISSAPEGARNLLSKQKSSSRTDLLAAIALGLRDSPYGIAETVLRLSEAGPKVVPNLLRLQPSIISKVVDELDDDESFTEVSNWIDVSVPSARQKLARELLKKSVIQSSSKLLQSMLSNLDERDVSAVIKWQLTPDISFESSSRLESYFSKYPQIAISALLAAGIRSFSAAWQLGKLVRLEDADTIVSALDGDAHHEKAKSWFLAAVIAGDTQAITHFDDSTLGSWLKVLISKNWEPTEGERNAAAAVILTIRPEKVAVYLKPAFEREIERLENAAIGRRLAIGVSLAFLNGTLTTSLFDQWLQTRFVSSAFKNAWALEDIPPQAGPFDSRSVSRLWYWTRAVCQVIDDNSRVRRAGLIETAFSLSGDNWTDLAIDQWISLLTWLRSQEHSGVSYLDAHALRLALGGGNPMLSRLICATFPEVYLETVAAKSKSFLDLVFPFSDWDKGKDLRMHLIRAYDDPEWPAADLLITAFRAKILDKVVSRAIRTGRAHLIARAEAALRANPSADQMLKRKLRKLLAEGVSEDWD